MLMRCSNRNDVFFLSSALVIYFGSKGFITITRGATLRDARNLGIGV